MCTLLSLVVSSIETLDIGQGDEVEGLETQGYCNLLRVFQYLDS